MAGELAGEDEIDVTMGEDNSVLDKAVELYMIGVPLKEIRRLTGVSYALLYRELRRRGISLRRGSHRRLTREEKEEIRRLYCCEHWSKYRIAVLFNVVYQTVYRILRGVDCRRVCDSNSN